MKRIIRTLKSVCAAALAAFILAQLCGCSLFIIETEESGVPGTQTGSPQTSEETVPLTEPDDTVPSGQRFPELDVDYSECFAKLQEMRDDDFSSFTLQIRISDACNDVIGGSDDFLTEYCELRNKIVADKFSTRDFLIGVQSEETVKNDLSASVKAGTGSFNYFSDLLIVPDRTAGSLAAAGLLMNLRKLPFYESPTGGSAAAGMNVNSCFVHVSGLTDDIVGTSVLYFNRSIAGEQLSKDMYSKALSDGFTFGYLLTCIAGLPGKTAEYDISLSYGTYGIDFLADAAAIRSGFVLAVNEAGKNPVLAVHEESETAAMTELLGKLGKLRLFEADAEDPETEAYAKFVAGKSAFHLGTVKDIQNIYKERIAWGILPLPYSDGMAGRTENAQYARPVVTVPSNNTKATFTGVMLNALDIATGKWIGEGFANKCIEFRLGDNDSFYVLRKILSDGTYCDFARIYVDSVKGFDEVCYGALRDCIRNGTDFAAKVETNRKTVDNLLKNLKK